MIQPYSLWRLFRFSLLAALAMTPVSGLAQMVSPEIDRGPVFSYYSQPTDLIGVMGAPSGTEITPEGYLYNGFGELMFFTGPEQTPLAARVRTLTDGRLPIAHYGVTHEGIEYQFKAFAAQVPHPQVDESTPTGQIVNFVRITVHNPGSAPQAAFLTLAERYQGEQTTAEPLPDNRFRRPAEPDRVGDYRQPGETFKTNWSYTVGEGSCLREDRVLFRYPSAPEPQLSLTLRTHYNRIQPLSNANLKLTPTTPVCSVRYSIPLVAGESRTLDIAMPLLPPQKDSVEAKQLAEVNADEAEQGVIAYWNKLFAHGMRIRLPEAKPVQTFDANLVYDLLGRNIIDGKFVQTAGEFQYHRFYLRDSADFVRMYDATGYPEIGSQVINFFLDRQQPDGNFLSQPGQFDGWGQALWAFGEHYRRTHDLEFARKSYPAILRAVEWFERERAKDPLHVMPSTDVRDNEYVSGHLTGYNFLAMNGLDSAAQLARALGHPDDAARFLRDREELRRAFFPLLDKASREQGGKLPPSLDAGAWKGTDWGNLLAVTPEPVLDPWDPRVTATLKSTQAHYQEGITTYAEPDDGIFLHHYLIIKNTLTELVRGEQEQAMREFYALLLHTGSTHAGFEYAIRPWGMRDFEGNLSPHAWFAADYRNLLRNMLVREQGQELHLLSAISPEWVGAGKQIAVDDAPTYWGKLNFHLKMQDETSAVLALDTHFDQGGPEKIVVHIPWFLTVTEASVDGHALKPGTALELPATARELHLHWKANASPKMNYERTVASYKAEYRRRWEHLQVTGDATVPSPDPWQVPE